MPRRPRPHPPPRRLIKTTIEFADSLALDMQPNGCILESMSMDAVFRALADKSRRRLLDRLRARNGLTLNEMCGGLDMTRQAVTKHLVILEEANLIVTQKRGREKLHFL